MSSSASLHIWRTANLSPLLFRKTIIFNGRILSYKKKLSHQHLNPNVCLNLSLCVSVCIYVLKQLVVYDV